MDLDLSSASSASSGSLAPGFRFHPTDEELVSYYLKRKVCGKPFRFDAICDVDVYKAEPWDLPGRSKMKTRDLEWYFFSALDKKYGNGSRTNRATERGYWKTTGKDRAVLHRAQTVGMKKTLVYHSGRAPRGERTNWVMHEYRLVDESLEKSGIFQDAFVLCRIFQKSGSGPKNGEQYGAPFVEEEWENDDLVMVPGGEARGEEAAEYDAFLDANDIDQILGADIPSGDAPLPFSYSYGDNSTNADDPLDFIDDAKKLLLSMGGAPDQPDDENFLDFPVQNYVDAIPVKQEYFGESSNSANFDPDTFFDEPFFDVSNNQFADGAYLDIDDDVSQYLAAFGASDMMGSENLFSNQSCLTLENLNGGAQQDSIGSQQLFQGLDNYVESSSKTEVGKLGSDTQHPLTKQANRKLGSLPAPPAFASEFPTKEAALLLSSMSQSSSPAHITAGMIQIRDMTPSGNRPHWSFGKNANVNIFLSFGPPPNGLNPAMVGLAALRCWLYMLFLWVLLLSVKKKKVEALNPAKHSLDRRPKLSREKVPAVYTEVEFHLDLSRKEEVPSQRHLHVGEFYRQPNGRTVRFKKWKFFRGRVNFFGVES